MLDGLHVQVEPAPRRCARACRAATPRRVHRLDLGALRPRHPARDPQALPLRAARRPRRRRRAAGRDHRAGAGPLGRRPTRTSADEFADALRRRARRPGARRAARRRAPLALGRAARETVDLVTDFLLDDERATAPGGSPRSPRRRSWSPSTSLLDPRISDLPAAEFRTWLFETEGFTIWNGQWYAGHHTPGYSIVFPPLAALLGGPEVVGAISTLASAAIFERIVRRHFGPRGALGRALVRLRGGHAAVLVAAAVGPRARRSRSAAVLALQHRTPVARRAARRAGDAVEPGRRRVPGDGRRRLGAGRPRTGATARWSPPPACCRRSS